MFWSDSGKPGNWTGVELDPDKPAYRDLPNTGSMDAASPFVAVINANGAMPLMGSSGNDVIINRQNGPVDRSSSLTNINAGSGDDIIFNFGKNIVSLEGGGGNDAIFSVGLTSGAITAGSSAGDAYVKLINSMTGGSISLGKGRNVIDAKGATLTNTSIADGGDGTTSTALRAKGITGGSVNLGATMTGVDLGTLSSSLTLGAGGNSLVADSVLNATIISTGTDSYQLKNITGGTINSSNSAMIQITGGAKGASFDLGSGANTINATGRTLTSVNITDKAGASTAILAGSITGTAASKSKVALKGNTTDGNGVVAGKAISYADIDTGTGQGHLESGSVTNSILKMGIGGTSVQTVNIKGAMTGNTLETGDGNDDITIGAAKNSTVKLGGGNNTYTGKTASNLTYSGGAGQDNLNFTGSIINSDIDLGQGVNSLIAKNALDVAQAVTNTSIRSDGATTIEAGKYTAGATGNTIELGAGGHSVTFASITASKGARATVNMGVGGSQAQKLEIKGGVSNLDYSGSNGTDTLTLYGALANSTIDLGQGVNSLTAKNAKGVAQAVTNTAIKSYGATTIEAGKYTAGATGNTIELGAGEHSVTLASITASRGARATVKIGVGGSQAQKLEIKGGVNNLDYIGSNGTDTLTLYGALANSTIDLGQGANSLTAKNAKGAGLAVTNTAIKSYGATTIEAGKYTAGATGNTIELGAGEHSVTLASIAGSKTVAMALNMDTSGTSNQTLNVAGAVTNATITTGAGTGAVRAGSMTNATLTMGGAAGLLSRTIDIIGNMTSSMITAGGGGTAMTVGGSVKNSAVEAGKGDNSLAINKTASGLTYTGSSQKDDVSVKGALSASRLDLGDGANSVTVVTQNAAGITVGQTISNTNITATGTASTSITAGKYLSGKTGSEITLGTGANSIKLIG
ncbi:hypothetical protein LJC23_05375 [Desulfovibrio sp. OttesenSCG-928-I05]|nr:hypothetical protein [Desulfovibrio sp. OttesenSCG-928-I05]